MFPFVPPPWQKAALKTEGKPFAIHPILFRLDSHGSQFTLERFSNHIPPCQNEGARVPDSTLGIFCRGAAPMARPLLSPAHCKWLQFHVPCGRLGRTGSAASRSGRMINRRPQPNARIHFWLCPIKSFESGRLLFGPGSGHTSIGK